jgi:hypothetical protein
MAKKLGDLPIYILYIYTVYTIYPYFRYQTQKPAQAPFVKTSHFQLPWTYSTRSLANLSDGSWILKSKKCGKENPQRDSGKINFTGVWKGSLPKNPPFFREGLP